MKRATVSAVLKSNRNDVWNMVTDNANYTWRSDLTKIAVFDDGNGFVEYTKDGFATEFVVTKKEPYSRYEFKMANKNMAGNWIGLFEELENGTRVEFIEEVTVNNPVMNLFVGAYLKKQQALYISDLKKVLGE